MNEDDNTYTITFDALDESSSDAITITLDDFSGDYVVDTSDYSLDTNFSNWTLTSPAYIDPTEVEKMCAEYPGLDKVWRNFKSTYDMCKQDYEGKKKAGEVDDDIPF